uniref:Alpha-macroglobulin receptor-binding domain-containing protein n=1 Tax=Scophthalmus maximus TaxID=52904 RepID=A0A8D3BUN6_SCOMX
MIHMTLPVIATRYLDKTNQWEIVGFQKRNEAFHKNIVCFCSFRKKDGSFAVWTNRKGSTWLTAYVAKVFTMANNLETLQKDVICGAVKFLILNAQHPDACSEKLDRYMLYHLIRKRMCVRYSEASMMAFCHIAMQESRTLCTATVNSLPGSIDKAVAYLGKQLPSLTNPYVVAMTSYALANEGNLDREILFKFVSPELSHWSVPKGHIYTLEATAYALLALVKAKNVKVTATGTGEATVTVNKKHVFARSSIICCTSTCVLFIPDETRYIFSLCEQCLSNGYLYYLMTVHSILKCPFFLLRHRWCRSTRLCLQRRRATVSSSTCPWSSSQVICRPLSLVVFLLSFAVILSACMCLFCFSILLRYKDRDRDATMWILDIGLLTGFTVNTNDLDLVRYIAKYEMNTLLSERGSLIIYLDKVSQTRPEEITFRIHQKLKVGILQPAAVSVYEYYDQTQCVKFYHPVRTAGQLLRLCRNKICTCAAGKQDGVSVKMHLKFLKELFSTLQGVCRSGHRQTIPHHGQVVSLFFVSTLFVCCVSYLVLFHSKHLTCVFHFSVHRYQYVLGERTWIEYWPTAAGCQTDQHRLTCLGLEEIVQQHLRFGCQL